MVAGTPNRAAVAIAAGLLGLMAGVAASQREVPARGARRLELVDLINEQDGRVRELRRDLRLIEQDLAALSETRAGPAGGIGRQIRELEVRAGTGSLAGPGVVVTLDDSSASRSPTGDPNDLVVHERDIQTVVNALWSAGAEAVAVNGERLTALSAVRCAGNTLLLHGAVHSPPYRIAAIGDPRKLQTSLSGRPGMSRLRAAARAFGLGYRVEASLVRIAAGPGVPGLADAAPVS